MKIKLRLVQESDISQLYEMLKEMYDTQNSSINERPLVPFEDSKKFVKKYLHDNENHEISKWYIILDENNNNILGSAKISHKNYVSYQVLKRFRNKGIGTKAVELIIQLNPKERYFAIINEKNTPSMKLIKKLGFNQKAIVFEKIINSFN